MRRLPSLAAALLAVALLAAGCGSGSGPAPPKGPPELRNHGEDATRVEQVESARAAVVAAESLYAYFHRAGDARHQLALASRGYADVTGLVRPTHPVLDREIHAAFEATDALLVRQAATASVNFRMDALRNQLLEAALDATTTAGARSDPTVAAAALVHFTSMLDASYSKSARLGTTDQGRQEFHTAFGLLNRSQALWKEIRDALGPEGKTVGAAISSIRTSAFPFGVGRPGRAAPKPLVVHRKVLKAQAALAKRFDL